MKFKKNNGLAGIDMIIATIAISIFSTLIVSMIYNNVLENVKLKKETMAMIYSTEIFENIAIESYDNVTQENSSNFIPEKVLKGYTVNLNISTDLDDVNYNQNIIKKIVLTLSYEVGNKTYTCTMQRMKIKE